MANIKTNKEYQLDVGELMLVDSNDHKDKLVLNPSKMFDDKIAKLDKTLLTDLGPDMRIHITNLRTKLISEGRGKYISGEMKKINDLIVEANVKKDELISK